MNTGFLRLIPSIFVIIYATYGTWFLVIEIFCSIVPFTIIFACLIALAVHFFSISPPDANAVEAVLGKEPHLENDASDYVMRTVAHRGAGLDAPENSLEAFKLVGKLLYIHYNIYHIFHTLSVTRKDVMLLNSMSH